MTRRAALKLAAGMLALLPLACAAAANAATEGALLSISGATAQGKRTTRVFTERELLGMPTKTLDTSTAWTSRSTFAGPSLMDVLNRAGYSGGQVEVVAWNNYRYSIDLNNIRKYQPILAHSMNGARLTMSNFGPFFIVYPLDAYPDELSLPTARAKFVWQVKELIVR